MSTENNKTQITIEGAALPCVPSSVQTQTEIIRNTERALDGTMCIDVVAEKASLQILWDLVPDDDYRRLRDIFCKDAALSVKTAAGLFNEEEGAEVSCYVDSIAGQPLFLDDGLYWQSVSVVLTEV